ncbi:MAG: transcriptional regulator GcvA [SAR324 cluster bacterium]|nr:transcriptional regulator GcvA [SAR324 cluster bacterium]
MNIELPPLNGFYVFESAARHLSFTKAAAELYVTQAAVSQQIKNLEEHLGFKLFHRLTRQLVLTEEGRQLAEEVRIMLNHLADVVNELKSEDIGGILTVSTIPSFAMKWLIPRLRAFNQQYPEITLQLNTSEQLVNFRTDKIDMAIRYGRGNYKGLHSTFMMRDEIFPVCSPDLLKEKSLQALTDLRNHILLYDTDQSPLMNQETDWNTWLTAVGATEIYIKEKMSFTGTHMAIEAAIMGEGIALGRTSLSTLDLSTGRLICPFDYRTQSENAYYIVSLEEAAEKPRIKIFRDWLLEQAARP